MNRRSGINNTMYGIETMHMIRNGQIVGALIGQVEFINEIFGVAA